MRNKHTTIPKTPTTMRIRRKGGHEDRPYTFLCLLCRSLRIRAARIVLEEKRCRCCCTASDKDRDGRRSSESEQTTTAATSRSACWDTGSGTDRHTLSNLRCCCA